MLLDLRVRFKRAKELERSLGKLAASGVPAAAKRALTRIAERVYGEAFKLLDGPGRKKVRSRDYRGKKKTRSRGQHDRLGARPGSYPPVPSITGNLKRKLGHVPPGSSKTVGGLTFRAGPMEAVVFDAAEYARVIHEGEGSSARYGPRPYLTDGLDAVDAVGIAEEELAREVSG